MEKGTWEEQVQYLPGFRQRGALVHFSWLLLLFFAPDGLVTTHVSMPPPSPPSLISFHVLQRAYLPLGVGSFFGHHLLQNPFWIPLMLQAKGFPVLSLPLASGSTFPMTTVTL